jgi:transposase, IS5 family
VIVQEGKREPEVHRTARGYQWFFGMKAHIGVDSRTKLVHTVLIRAGATPAKDYTHQRHRRGKRVDESVRATNRRKSSVRAKVEHVVFGLIKRVFGFQKVSYRGLDKNLHRPRVTAALAPGLKFSES